MLVNEKYYFPIIVSLSTVTEVANEFEIPSDTLGHIKTENWTECDRQKVQSINKSFLSALINSDTPVNEALDWISVLNMPQRVEIKLLQDVNKFYNCKDFLEMAEIINSSKLFIGNLSFGYTIAEGDVVAIALDVDAGKVWYRLGDGLGGSQTPGSWLNGVTNNT